MGCLPDYMIRDAKVCEPLADGIKRENVISYGVTSYGYDARVGYKFKVFSPINCTEIDPKNFDPKALVDVDLTPKECTNKFTYRCDEQIPIHRCKACQHNMSLPNYIRIPPHSFALAETLETFDIPRDTLCIVIGKSTYARCGIVVNVTPLEPEWKGKVTVEISNTTPLPARIYAGEGIMQCVFIKGFATCKTSYADKKGKYQNQTGLTLPTVDTNTHPEGK